MTATIGKPFPGPQNTVARPVIIAGHAIGIIWRERGAQRYHVVVGGRRKTVHSLPKAKRLALLFAAT
jgi:hypothetical protein